MGARTLVARNTAWNLLGAVLPIPVALACMPVLIGALGVERFGVLGVAWMVLGYFGMFDFGLAQSTTKFVSTAVASGARSDLRALAVGSVLLHCALGMAGGATFAMLVPWLTAGVFELPASLMSETRIALYWLAASVPAIVVTAALRGVVEGLQRFDIVNLIRIPASIVNYAGPVIALYFGTGLPLVVAVIVLARFAVLAAYGLACLRVLPSVPHGGRVDGAQLLRLATYGGWLTASNLINPVIIAADRFAIAATVSVAAVAYYVTPYEIITKAWILSASLMGAAFPVFSALMVTEPGAIRAACRSAQRTLLAVATPLIALVLGCADLLLEWWLGADFRDYSTAVAQLLALGILFNIVAQVPLTALNAAGRADVTARVAALELPIYVAAIWYGAAHYGITGVAALWATRAFFDALALFFAANRVLPKEVAAHQERWIGIGRAAGLSAFLGAAWATAYALPHDVAIRLSVLAVLLATLVVWEWWVLLTRDDRESLGGLCRRLLTVR
jgi:O-antigen/teichoic acid export membrane protein